MSYADVSQLATLPPKPYDKERLETHTVTKHRNNQNMTPLSFLIAKVVEVWMKVVQILSGSNPPESVLQQLNWKLDAKLESISLEEVSRSFLIHAPRSLLIHQKKKELVPYAFDESTLTHASVLTDPSLLKENLKELSGTIQSLISKKDLAEEDREFSENFLDYLLENEKFTDHERYLQMGMFLYCLDHQSKKVLKKIRKLPPEKIEHIVRLKFFKVLKKKIDHLNAIMTTDQSQALFDPGVDVKTQIPVETAKFLIASNGRFNLGLIPLMKTLFKNKQAPLLNYEINFQNTLQLIENSKEMREQISSTLKPLSKNMLSNHVIRTTLNLPFTHKVTDSDAVKCLLVALLSHLRQENSRSCFTTAIASSILRSNPEQCIQDLQSLLRNSHLTRTVDGVKHHVSFLLHLGKTALDTAITLDRNGHINPSTKGSKKIWESNVYLTVCQALEIRQPKQFSLDFLREKLDRHDHLEITIDDLLKEMSRFASRTVFDGNPSEGELNLLANLAFEANIMNPLLKVWENAIAGISERGISKSFFGFYFFSSIIASIRDHLNQKYPDQPEGNKSLCRLLFDEIKDEFVYLYDPSISPKEWMIGGEEGGFVLYNKNGCENLSDWHQIKNGDQLQLFINAKVKKLLSSKELGKTFKEMKRYCQSKAFIPDIIKRFQNSIVGKVETSPLALPYFGEPWLVRSGYDARRIIDTYFDSRKDIDSIQINPMNAQHLLKKLIKIHRNFSDDMKRAFQDDPFMLKPMRILNLHACCLMPGHPSFRLTWESEELSPEVWIEEQLIKPGMEIANSQVTDEMKEKLIAYAQEEIPKKKWSKFEKFLKNGPSSSSVQAFRQRMADAISKFQDLHLKPLEVYKLEIDHVLFYSLSEARQADLKQSAVHFADSNLHERDHDLHYCFILNPGSGAVEVWEIKDDNSSLHPLDQGVITEDETWEIFDI